MATTRLVHPPIPAPQHLLKQHPKIKTGQITLSAPAPRCNYSPAFYHCPCPFVSRSKHSLVRTASEEQSSGLLEDPNDTTALTKSSIYQALQGINRGVFGVTSAKRKEIADLVMQLESHNPTPNPTFDLEKVKGSWKLIYSTITILGPKRTKLGLRDFITLGDFLQIIDVTEGKAVNIIKFNARGLSLLNGQLTIKASFTVASSTRVNIKYDKSDITPDQLMNLFKTNYDILLGIFNPEGWLDITYVDETMRIGRDDKGNIFILERPIDNDQI